MSHILRSVQTQRVDLAANTWNTAIFIPLGKSGTIKNIMIDVNTGNFGVSPVTGTPARELLVTMTANNAAVPQVGGLVRGTYCPLQLQQLFGPGLGATNLYRAPRIGTTSNDASYFSGYWNRDIPFSDGFRIDLYCPGAIGSKFRTWIIIEYTDDLSPEVFHADLVSDTVTPLGVATILTTNQKTRLLGLWQRFTPQTAGPNYWFVEGDHRIYYDGSPTAAYQSNGMEDFFGSSNYFGEGTYWTDRVGCLIRNSTTGQFSCYRFFDEESPIGDYGLTFTWTSGDPAPVPPPPYNIKSEAVVFYYLQ